MIYPNPILLKSGNLTKQEMSGNVGPLMLTVCFRDRRFSLINLHSQKRKYQHNSFFKNVLIIHEPSTLSKHG